MKQAFKTTTVILAFIWVMALCVYSSLLLGTLAHELTHKAYAIETTAIEVNYDNTGIHRGATFDHSHEWVYLNGYIVETFLILISMLSIIILLVR